MSATAGRACDPTGGGGYSNGGRAAPRCSVSTRDRRRQQNPRRRPAAERLDPVLFWTSRQRPYLETSGSSASTDGDHRRRAVGKTPTAAFNPLFLDAGERFPSLPPFPGASLITDARPA
ncbi:unnamed protein product [Merluccius merluccius]